MTVCSLFITVSRVNYRNRPYRRVSMLLIYFAWISSHTSRWASPAECVLHLSLQTSERRWIPAQFLIETKSYRGMAGTRLTHFVCYYKSEQSLLILFPPCESVSVCVRFIVLTLLRSGLTLHCFILRLWWLNMYVFILFFMYFRV